MVLLLEANTDCRHTYCTSDDLLKNIYSPGFKGNTDCLVVPLVGQTPDKHTVHNGLQSRVNLTSLLQRSIKLFHFQFSVPVNALGCRRGPHKSKHGYNYYYVCTAFSLKTVLTTSIYTLKHAVNAINIRDNTSGFKYTQSKRKWWSQRDLHTLQSTNLQMMVSMYSEVPLTLNWGPAPRAKFNESSKEPRW